MQRQGFVAEGRRPRFLEPLFAIEPDDLLIKSAVGLVHLYAPRTLTKAVTKTACTTSSPTFSTRPAHSAAE